MLHRTALHGSQSRTLDPLSGRLTLLLLAWPTCTPTPTLCTLHSVYTTTRGSHRPVRTPASVARRQRRRQRQRQRRRQRRRRLSPAASPASLPVPPFLLAIFFFSLSHFAYSSRTLLYVLSCAERHRAIEYGRPSSALGKQRAESKEQRAESRSEDRSRKHEQVVQYPVSDIHQVHPGSSGHSSRTSSLSLSDRRRTLPCSSVPYSYSTFLFSSSSFF